jgi:type I site-specific restriction endonuclease
VTVKPVYGNQKWMQELEDVDLLYWFRLKQSKAVRELIGLIERENDWMQSSPSGSGWSYCESTLQLSGWNRSRRVVVYRRVHRRKVPSKLKALLPWPTEQSKQLALEQVEEALTKYEYAVYVTTLKQPAGQIRSLYNPRGDNENSYDELKNQWGWCGFTLKDLARSELMACLIALIYNGWSLYTKLVEEEIAREAITSRPMFLMHVAKASTHQSMRFLVIFCAHAQLNQIKKKLEIATLRLKEWASLTAEQLKARSLWKRIIGHILSYHRSFGGQSYRAPPMIEAPV